jgi:TolB protein
MPDLRTLLHQAAGDPPDLPDLAAIRERGDALKVRARLSWAAGAVAAAVVVAAGIGIGLGQSGRDAMPAPQPAHSTTRARVSNACPVQSAVPRDAIAYTAARSGASTRPDGAVHLMSPDGSGDRCLVDTAGPDTWPRWSPDGQWIAFTGGDGTQSDLYIVRADGSELTRLTDSPETEEGPVWSPDGLRLGYSSSTGGESLPSIHVVGRDGSGDAIVPTGPHRVWLADWSPDGGTLLYLRDDSDGGHAALWAMAPDGSGPRLLRSEEGDFGSGARYSPDGAQIAFQADFDGGCLYRSEPDVRHLSRLTTDCTQGRSISWSPDGTRIVTAGGSHGPLNAEVLTIAGNGVRTLTFTGDAAFVDWQPATSP